MPYIWFMQGQIVIEFKTLSSNKGPDIRGEVFWPVEPHTTHSVDINAQQKKPTTWRHC